ncbi:MAG: hypothetical protein JWQ07_498 [Ramlibacter sp.]|nr:hypothetical protein [Ramlibacter sp.]
MTKKTEAVTPPATIHKLLDAGGDDLVLVGGQALAFWVDRYGVSHQNFDLPAISNDVDFLSRSAGDKDSVVRLAAAMKGQTVFPNKRALTALVGQAVLDISDDEYINADVIFKLVGLEGETVRKRAVKITRGKGRPAFLVMHPLDVLHSRMANLCKLSDKQNDKGRMQLALAIEVGRSFLRAQALEINASDTAAGRSPLQDYVSAIERMAVEDAGRKVAARHGLHVADAIDPHLIPPGPFWTKRWPGLRKLMSRTYAESIQPPT